MTTTAELEQRLAQLQSRIAELRLKTDNNAIEAKDAIRKLFAAGEALRADPDNKALQQAQIEARATVDRLTVEFKPITNELNTALANERSLQQEITTTAPTKAREKQEEETTINPKTEPVGNQDVQSLIRKREQLAIEAQAAIDAGNRALADSLLTQILDLDDQISALDPTYRAGSPPVDAGGGSAIPNNNTNNDAFIRPIQESAIGPSAKDWRFRMSLAPSADYLYKANPPGILAPLIATEGVIFPYTPAITITYSSNYNAQDITHSNYKIYTYKNSAVEAITISADFTAQDSVEANYLLAVIHFFRSVTKMFYGQDQNPSRGVPPPLVYLHGFGQYQFDWHPVVISSFTHTFPQDVDFVEAYPTNNGISLGALDLTPYENLRNQNGMSSAQRLRGLSRQVQPGGLPPAPVFASTQNINEATRVPTKLTIQLNCLPIVTRNAISNKFSLKEYATGRLMRGSVNPGTGGGIW
jgi:phage shock protein A